MDLRSGRRLPCRFSIGESTRFRGGSVRRRGSGPGLGRRGTAWGRTTLPPCTYFISGGQVLVLVARVPLFPVQEKEINHLLLVLPAGWGGEAARGMGKSVPGGAPPRGRAAPAPTYSSDSRSCRSLLRSRKQPSECMLSSTSGSMSSRLGSERSRTLRGMGCSGSGSFLPPLRTTGTAGSLPTSSAAWASSAPTPRCRDGGAHPFLGPESYCSPCAQPLHASCVLPEPSAGRPGTLESQERLRLGPGLRWAGSPPAFPSRPSRPQ